jgi:hypothetical protein
MGAVGQRPGLTHLVVPVRPSFKDRYTLTAIERYVTWRREDGQQLDPWMWVHERLSQRSSCDPIAQIASDHRNGRRMGMIEGFP